MFYNQRFYIIHIRYLVYIAVATATYLLLSLSVYLTRVIQSKESVDTCEGDCDVCKIPEPLLLMENWDMNVTESLECANKSLVMFKMNYRSRLERMNLDDDEFWRKVYCCYHSYWRLGSEPDFVLKSTTKCYPIIEDVTEIPNYHEFLDIYCYDIATRSRILYRDRLGNFLVKIMDENSDIVTSDSSLSIGILSIEALSRWNFRRYFPKSHRFILDRLQGVEFSGLHPLNLDRLANFFSLLSGGNLIEFFRACISEDAGSFDSCPFMWRGLVKKGYQTSFQEDRPTFAKYEWRRMELNDFRKSEFDLDLRILTHGVDKFTMGKTRRSNSSKNQECFGSRHRFQYLMENILLLMDGLKSQLYFHATRVTSLVSSKENLKFSDTVLENALREMQNRGLLNNTAFIIYSDQGNQGDLALESQLPLLYVILPPWFRKQYPKAMSNFYGNRNKLISVLHLHQTLMDLSNMKRITDEAIRNRSSVTDRTSLFTRLSSEATCKAADIGMSDCFICSDSSAVKSSDLAVESAATYIIGTINKKLRKNPACAQLRISLPGISSAWQVIVRREIDENGEAESDSPRKNSLITLERTLIFTVTTQPGNMSWRAIVVDKRDGEFVVKSLRLVHSSRNKEKRKQCKTTSIQTELREFCMCNEN